MWLFALAVATLSPEYGAASDTALKHVSWCLVCGERGTSDAILNVVLFLPLGLLADRPGRWSVFRVVLIGLVLSTSIELTQRFVPGRYSNLGDVAWNTAGAWLGAQAWTVRNVWLVPGPRWSPRLANLATLGFAVVTFAFGCLTEPHWSSEHYWGQWTPSLRGTEQYTGTVLGARLDTLAVPPGRFPAGTDPRSILTRDWTLRATVITGRTPKTLSPILRIADAEGREELFVGALGQDLVYREASRAAWLRFDQLDQRIPGGLRRFHGGDTLDLVVERRGEVRCLRLGSDERCPSITPGRSWSLLSYPLAASENAKHFMDAMWAGCLLLPVGIYSRRRRGLVARASGAAILTGLAVALTRLGVPGIAEIVAGLGGLVVGHLLGLATERLRAGGTDRERA